MDSFFHFSYNLDGLYSYLLLLSSSEFQIHFQTIQSHTSSFHYDQ